MQHREIPRRTVLKTAGAAAVTIAGPARAAGAADEVVSLGSTSPRRSRQPGTIVGHPLIWEYLDTRLTPNDEFFTVKHYNLPASTPHVPPGRGRPGRHPLSLSLDRPREPAPPRGRVHAGVLGQHRLAPFFIGGIGNARWAGAPLAPAAAEADLDEATEVVFWGADSGTVTIRDNTGIIGAGDTGVAEPDGGAGST